ncbi:MAG: c-type cytochrome biogenesis protein CcmI, partial [Pseudomonadota bacterium]
MMFWLAFAIMAAFVVAFLFPAFFGAVRAEDDEEITTYFAQIDTIQSDADVPEEEAKAAVVALQKQILAKQEGGEGGLGVSKWGGGLTLGLLIIMAGIVYADQATFTALNPNDRPVTNAVEAPLASSPERQIYQNTQLRNLVAQLEQRLATDRANDPAGWQLYARSLITLGEYDRAISA